MFSRRYFKRSAFLLSLFGAFAGGHWYLHQSSPPFVTEVRSYLAPAAAPANDPRDTIRQIAAVIAHPHALLTPKATPVPQPEAPVAPRPVVVRVESARLGPQGAVRRVRMLSVPRVIAAAHVSDDRDAVTPDLPEETPDDFARNYVLQANPGTSIDSSRVISQQGNDTTLEIAMSDGTAHLTERIVVADNNGTYEVVTEERTSAHEGAAEACYNGRAWEECHGGV